MNKVHKDLQHFLHKHIPDVLCISRHDVQKVLPAWLYARFLLVFAWALTQILSKEYFAQKPLHLSHGLIGWDGTYYYDIAIKGYKATGVDSVRFFSLYPSLGRLFGYVIPNMSISLLIISNVCAFIVAVWTYKYLKVLGKNDTSALRAVWLLMIFPASFVFIWAYAESLMIAAGIACFLCIEKKRWVWAAFFACIASATRPLGMFLVLPILYAQFISLYPQIKKEWYKLSISFLPILPVVAYMLLIQQRFGDYRLPFTVQNKLRSPELNIISRMYISLRDLFDGEKIIGALHTPFAFFFLFLLFLVWKKMPRYCALYCTIVLFVALGAENFNSIERYALNAFPLLMVISFFDWSRIQKKIYLISLSSGFIALCSLAWLGIYVP